MIGAANRRFVVFDHDHGVAQIAQFLQRAQQVVLIARVQPDGRLVEHVEYPGEPRTDLAREPDALRFPAGEGMRGAIEREISKAHLQQKAQARADRAQRQLGHWMRGAGGGDFFDRRGAARQGQRRELRQAHPRHAHGPGEGLQAAAAAGRAGQVLPGQIQLLLLARSVFIGAVAPLEIGDPALERMGLAYRAAAIERVAKVDGFSPEPKSRTRRTGSGSSCHGVSREKP